MREPIYFELPISKVQETLEKQDEEGLRRIVREEAPAPFDWDEIARMEFGGELIAAIVWFRLHYK